jgi:hypothetical protein
VVTITPSGNTLRFVSPADRMDISIPMDGKHHAIPGKPYTVAWTRIDKHTWEEVRKTDGRVVDRTIRKVSQNGLEMSVDRTMLGEPIQNVFIRELGSDPVSDPFVGTWENNYESKLPQVGGRLHFDCANNRVQQFGPGGNLLWSAVPDAAQPRTGGGSSVSLRRTSADTFQVTRSANGRRETTTWTVSADGKSIDAASGPVRLGHPGRVITTYVRFGQPEARHSPDENARNSGEFDAPAPNAVAAQSRPAQYPCCQLCRYRNGVLQSCGPVQCGPQCVKAKPGKARRQAKPI